MGRRAATQTGTIALTHSADGFVLTVGQRQQLRVRHDAIEFTNPEKPKKTWVWPRASARIIVARSMPRGGFGLWYEGPDNRLQRLIGAQAHPLMAVQAFTDRRDVERVIDELCDALRYTEVSAFEYGSGADRLLVEDDGEEIVLYGRKLFRELHQWIGTVHEGGVVEFLYKKSSRSIEVQSRYGVVVTGDRIRFIDDLGEEIGYFRLPWIEDQDRDELAARIGERVHQEIVLPAPGALSYGLCVPKLADVGS